LKERLRVTRRFAWQYTRTDACRSNFVDWDFLEKLESASPMGITVSVIVPTLNRRSLLERLLQSLFGQTLSSDKFEVIVVNDGSADDTAELVKAFQHKQSNLVFFEQQRRGPAAARNTAGRAARGKYLAFTDDDCVPAEDWLERLIEVFERTGAVAVQGRTSTNDAACSPLTNQVKNEKGMFGVPTCNAGYRKDIFDQVGGFDESFPFPHNEDADLAWRVEKLGRIPFAPEVHVIHPPRRETLRQRANWVRFMESDFLLFAKHPDAYRERCTASPWFTIYRQAFVIAQIGALKASAKCLLPPFNPRCFLEGIALVLARGWNLIRFYPYYLRAAKRYRYLDQKPRPADSSLRPEGPDIKAANGQHLNQ
jgi:GT2 family glycosyltransferase